MFRHHSDRKVTKSPTATTSRQVEYSCDFCEDGPWTNEIDAEIHRKKEHRKELTHLYNDKNTHMCIICHRDQKSKSDLIKHVKEFHYYCSPNANRINREIFVCSHCNKLFFNKHLLSTHMQHWHTLDLEGKRSTRVHCPRCWRTIRVKSLWFHYLYHDMLNVNTCPICLKNCTSKFDVIEHMKTHPGHFSCNMCGYAATKELHFNAHMNRHRKNTVITSKKDVSRFFVPGRQPSVSRNYLYNLFRGIALVNEIQICILCREFCESDIEMKQHILSDHVWKREVKRKKHECVCGEEFFNRILLKQHVFKMKGNHKEVVDVQVKTEQETTLEEIRNCDDDKQQVVCQIYELNQITVDVNMLDSSAVDEATEKQMILKGLGRMEET
ncbi:PR domain zinc finger protein 15-like [Trichoplusia ni]|uniref:PR domain zinc finger protein 15-like n=1 Tax=Trichoplusia ni TaxID=7111 RepID=A0A7E5X5J2_TRINI|nr:PR domain zinc finger protein 15-like [Trichoplusia ni]